MPNGAVVVHICPSFIIRRKRTTLFTNWHVQNTTQHPFVVSKFHTPTQLNCSCNLIAARLLSLNHLPLRWLKRVTDANNRLFLDPDVFTVILGTTYTKYSYRRQSVAPRHCQTSVLWYNGSTLIEDIVWLHLSSSKTGKPYALLVSYNASRNVVSLPLPTMCAT